MLKRSQISQESTCVGVFFSNVAGPHNCNSIKRDCNTGFFQWILWIIKKYLFCVENFWTVDSETPMRLFKNKCFYRTSLVAASESFRFPACNLSKNKTPAKTFFCEFCKIFKNIFWQNASRWLVPVFICESW